MSRSHSSTGNTVAACSCCDMALLNTVLKTKFSEGFSEVILFQALFTKQPNRFYSVQTFKVIFEAYPIGAKNIVPRSSRTTARLRSLTQLLHVQRMQSLLEQSKALARGRCPDDMATARLRCLQLPAALTLRFTEGPRTHKRTIEA